MTPTTTDILASATEVRVSVAFFTGDTVTIFVEKLLSGLKRLNRNPRYCAPHLVTGLRGSDGATEWLEPEAVAGTGIHRPVKGRVDIRAVPEAYARDLATIDAERKQLRERLWQLDKEEREVLALAWAAAKPLTVAEVKALGH